ncbi:uncharacterized protein TNCV_810271 [Trichonephila clavipes]|uniref:Uncharacterized protein n=1 Tax=Trichonephila clavipes TaxID=2585209 RepID=A0A8X6S838_TRICX|nr:uncharacterized protein TNCV_810271 [Trichonephila clavipes]
MFKLYPLIGRISHLGIENKELLYTAVMRPILAYASPTKHRSHASRVPSIIQSPSCHLAECKTPLSPCPSSKTCPDMGLRTVLTVQKPKKATPIQCETLRSRLPQTTRGYSPSGSS